MTEPRFECHQPVERYSAATLVDDLLFAIAPGECLGVVAPNGAGKTTTIRMCLGLTARTDRRATGARLVEVYGTCALALARDAEHTALRALTARVEVSGETVFSTPRRPCC